MEGVVDHLMRELLCEINDYDLCITEFIRVVDRMVPKQTFLKICPELENKGFTKCGTPLRLQLLGQEPNWMAENALRAIELGSNGVDINFGCPSKTVNNSKGGAVLLKEPEQVYKIIQSVRSAVTESEQVSAKIRLGFEDTSLFQEIVDAVFSANANSLTIHARTKKQGYIAPAYWHHIAPITKNSKIPIYANGEIWTRQDAKNCIGSSNTTNLMLGRGALAMPNLANIIKYNEAPMTWEHVAKMLERYSAKELKGDKSFYFSSRMKQWLRYLRLQHPKAEAFFQAIKTDKNKNTILEKLAESY